MKRFKGLALVGILLLGSCSPEQKEWQYTELYSLGEARPVGIALIPEGFWISDGDNNRLLKTDRKGVPERFVDSLERPMHIDVVDEVVYVPQYGNDRVGILNQDVLQQTKGPGQLDAPAGVSVRGKTMAIADFYSNKVHYRNEEGKWSTFGEKGNAPGEFLYPTDVQITEEGIWVADAYNHRAQLIDFEGNPLKVIGEDQDINAATGIWVTPKEVFLTDFENDRVWVYNKAGEVIQMLADNIHRPIDLVSEDDNLWIINFRKGELLKYQFEKGKE